MVLEKNIFQVYQLVIPGRHGQFEAQELGCHDLCTCRVPLDIAVKLTYKLWTI